MNFAGVYSCLEVNPRNLGELSKCQGKVFGGPKDIASVKFEISCMSGFKKQSGVASPVTKPPCGRRDWWPTTRLGRTTGGWCRRG